MKVFRIENPNISPEHDWVNSHEELLWQWFDPHLDYVCNYLVKNQRTKVWSCMQFVQWAKLVVLDIPDGEANKYNAWTHGIAQGMDIEPTNLIIPRNEQNWFHRTEISLDDIEMVWGNFKKLLDAKARIRDKLLNLWI